MAITLTNINIGNLANDGTGDPLRVAFTKINNNFANLSNVAPTGPDLSFQYKIGDTTQGSSSLTIDPVNNALNLHANVIPTNSTDVNIGNANLTIAGLYLGGNALHVGNINLVESNNTITFPVTGNGVAKGNLSGLNSITLYNNLNIGNSTVSTRTVTTLDFSQNQIVYSKDATTFKSMIAKITSVDAITLYSQTVTLNISKREDNTDSSYSAHSTMFSGYPITRYNVDINYGLLRVMVSPIVNERIDHIVEITTYN